MLLNWPRQWNLRTEWPEQWKPFWSIFLKHRLKQHQISHRISSTRFFGLWKDASGSLESISCTSIWCLLPFYCLWCCTFIIVLYPFCPKFLLISSVRVWVRVLQWNVHTINFLCPELLIVNFFCNWPNYPYDAVLKVIDIGKCFRLLSFFLLLLLS